MQPVLQACPEVHVSYQYARRQKTSVLQHDFSDIHAEVPLRNSFEGMQVTV